MATANALAGMALGGLVSPRVTPRVYIGIPTVLYYTGIVGEPEYSMAFLFRRTSTTSSTLKSQPSDTDHKTGTQSTNAQGKGLSSLHEEYCTVYVQSVRQVLEYICLGACLWAAVSPKKFFI